MAIRLAFTILIAHCISSHDTHAESFGDRQIAQVLDDRPAMRDIVPTDHPIYRFASEKFSTGGLQNRRVHWDNTEPMYGAEHACETLCVVRVASDQGYTGRDKWAMLIFELFNLSHAGDVGKLRWKVVHGEIDKDAFVHESLRLEIDAMRRTQAFLTRYPIPGVAPTVYGFYYRFLATPFTIDEYLGFLDRNQRKLRYDPRVYNAKIYDSLRPSSTPVQNGG